MYVDYYINHRVGEFAKELYYQDLEICTLGTYSEYGDANKDSFSDYCRIFEEVIDGIK